MPGKFESDEKNPPTPQASCFFCMHRRGRTTCSAYPNGIPPDITAGKDYHLDLRKDQVGTDVFKAIPGIALPAWMKK